MNPYITKDKADFNMVSNLAATGAIATALTTKTILKLFNKYGSKDDNYLNYQLAKNLAMDKKFINPIMQFTDYQLTTKGDY